MKPLPLIIFAYLYLIQGAIASFVLYYLKPTFLQFGLTITQAGALSSLLFVPFMLKIPIAMLSDYLVQQQHWLTRRRFLVLGLFLAILSLFGSSLAPLPHNLQTFSVMFIAASLGISIVDCLLDGIAVNSTDYSKQGNIQAAMFFGRTIGAAILITFFIFVKNPTSFQIFIFLTILTSAALPMTKHLPQESYLQKVNHFSWSIALKGKAIFILYILFAAMTISCPDSFITVFLSKKIGAQFSITQYALYKSLGGLAGAILSAYCFNRIAILKNSIMAFASIGICCVYFSISVPSSFSPILAIIWGSIHSYAAVLFVSICMKKTDHLHAATIFSLFMTIANIGNSMGEYLAGKIVESFGFQILYLSFIFLCAGAITSLVISLNAQSRTVGN
jgi:MFS family permease